MILYKKNFLLGKDISFSSYIKALERKRFPNYYLRIEKIPSTTNYHATIIFTSPRWEWGLRGPFIDGVLLKECTFQYSEGEKHFTIQASAKTINLFAASLSIIFAILFFIFAIFMIATNGGMSINNIFGFAIIMIFMLVPSILIYLQDKNFLDKVGSLGAALEKN